MFIAGEPVADRGRLVQVAQDGPDVGVYTVWLADDTSRLPVVCRKAASVEQAVAEMIAADQSFARSLP